MTERLSELDQQYATLRAEIPRLEAARKRAEVAYFNALQAERDAQTRLSALRNAIASAIGCPIDTTEPPTLSNGRW